MYENKKILIIGGTGTIGVALVNKLLKFNPNVIRIFSRDEYKQFVLAKRYENHKKLRFLIGDVRDEKRLERAMEEIDYVFHLAAMKHVSSCEYNPDEALKTNVIGVQNVIEAARKCNVKKVVYTSSDKAINPVNTYGATKMLSEKLIVSEGANSGKYKTKFFAVRFGNVMGSRGSVIPTFYDHMINGEPIQVTDPTMTRFMMTIDQATDLLLKAVEISVGGDTFILKMPSILLQDLIEGIFDCASKRVSGIKPYKQEIIGLRLGEKMYEELMTIEESENALELEDMYIIPPYFREHNYSGATKAKPKPYRSDDSEIVSKDFIVSMLQATDYFRLK